MSTQVDYAGLVRTLVEPIIEHKEDLQIELVEGDDVPCVEIRVHEDDAGKVIGRQGRVIKAVRTLARAAATRVGEHVDVELLD